MSEFSNIKLQDLSEKDLQKLINQSKKQIKKLKTQKNTTLNSRDADVAATADQVRALAKNKKVSPADALAAVAKNMRVAMVPKRKARAESPVKYRDPANPQNTWKGFGKRPIWLNEALKQGKKLDDFKV